MTKSRLSNSLVREKYIYEKTKLSFWVLFVIFSSFFVSCNDSDNDLDSTICKITVMSDGNGTVSFKDYNGTSLAILTGTEVTVVATPDNDCDFVGWFVGETEYPVSTDAEYTFTVTENMTLTAKFELPQVNGHEYIDLGLPSGLKWATWNVVDSFPEGYGGYFAWGETAAKDNYTESSYQHYNGCYINIGSDISGTQYDVARSQWGGNWRLPTKAEMQELVDCCTWILTTNKDVNGYKVTGPNGNSIFLPAAGSREGTGLSSRDYAGYYWSGTLYEGSTGSAYYMGFGRAGSYVSNTVRRLGRSVRPVLE